MKKTYAKFQINRYKTVRGVALTRGTHCLYTEGEKWISSQCGKVTKMFQQLYQNHMHILIPWRKQAKFQNNRFKTVPPSLIRVFAVHSIGSSGPKLSTCGQRIRWSDWADAQADLSLRCATMQFCWFCHGMAHLLCMWPGGSSLWVLFYFYFILFFFFFLLLFFVVLFCFVFFFNILSGFHHENMPT